MASLSRSRNLLASSYPLYLGGRPVITSTSMPVLDKYTQQPFCTVSTGDAALSAQAFELAHNAAPAMEALPSYERKRVLLHVASQIDKRKDEVRARGGGGEGVCVCVWLLTRGSSRTRWCGKWARRWRTRKARWAAQWTPSPRPPRRACGAAASADRSM